MGAHLRVIVSVLSLILLTLASRYAFAQEPSAEARARATEQQMTDDERFSLIISIGGFSRSMGRNTRYPEEVPVTAGYTPGVPRLGVPARRSGHRPDPAGPLSRRASMARS